MHSFATKTVRHRRLLGAGLLAIATLAGTSTYSHAQGLGTSGYGQNIQQPPSANNPAQQLPASTTVSSAVVTEKADYIIQVNETFSLRHEEGGLIKDVLASRPGIIKAEVDKDNPNIVRITGVNVGVTQVTLGARDKDNKNLAPTIKIIQVNPDISYIRSKIAAVFPTANLNINSGGAAGTYIVSGTVSSVEEIEPIRTFIDGIAAQYSRSGTGNLVTYALRVSGPQVVQLDVCLASVDRREVRRLGVDFFQRSGTNFLGTSIGGAGTTSISTADGLGLVQSAGSNFVFRTSQGANAFIGFVNALREERVGKIMSHPSLTALSGRPARFIVGGEEPFGTSGSVGSGGGSGAGIQFRPTGTVVAFLPVVLGDGRIRLTVSAENTLKTGDANQLGIIAPILATQSVGTTLELESGQSLVIGGLTENTVSGTTQKYPILGDLPFVGTLFRNVTFQEQEKEFVIIVKVNLVEGLDASQRCALKLPGQETRSPTDFELFIEGILEAPRGPRDIFPNRCYVPAFKNDVPFGARSGDCSLPGPLWNRNRDRDCNNGCAPACAPATAAPAAETRPPAALELTPTTPATIVPATTAPEGTSQALPVEVKPVEKTEVPVVSVPVVPASEAPAQVVPASEAPKQTDLPVPPIPPVPSSDPK